VKWNSKVTDRRWIVTVRRMLRSVVFLVLLLAMFAFSGCSSPDSDELDRLGQPAEGVQTLGPETRIKVDLPGAKDSVKVVRLSDGTVAYIVKRLGSGRDRLLTAAEFSQFLYQSRARDGWLETLFNITSPIGIIWVSLGILGQLLFTGRMLIQWFASEKSGKSVVPVAFWWMSLIGATMLLVYFIWRRDIVGIMGQATGWVIYIRNLVLIRRSRGG
jgi:lipid-A-disaccharide synthase-like uncharacterized protein